MLIFLLSIIAVTLLIFLYIKVLGIWQILLYVILAAGLITLIYYLPSIIKYFKSKPIKSKPINRNFYINSKETEEERRARVNAEVDKLIHKD